MLLSKIPESNLEKVRDLIGALLAIEFTHQNTIDPDDIISVKFFTERRVSVDHTECPAVSISFDKVEYGGKYMDGVTGEYIYLINVFAVSPTTDSATGDYLASKQVHRIMRMIRTILESPGYETLGIAPPFIGRTAVTGMNMHMGEVLDNLHTAYGTIMFSVTMPEGVVYSSEAYVLTDNYTRVKLSNTEGYSWIYARLHEGVYDVGYE